MAVQKINQIARDGVVYQFVDQESQEVALSVVSDVNKLKRELAQEVSDREQAVEGLRGDFVVKEPGKGLSTEDYTTEDKEKVNAITPFQGASVEHEGVAGYIGVVPQPEDRFSYFSGSGEFIGRATKTSDGTLGSEDKVKLDLMDADDMTAYAMDIFDDRIVTTYANPYDDEKPGKVHTVVFNADGSVTESITTSSGDKITFRTSIEDGRIRKVQVV